MYGERGDGARDRRIRTGQIEAIAATTGERLLPFLKASMSDSIELALEDPLRARVNRSCVRVAAIGTIHSGKGFRHGFSFLALGSGFRVLRALAGIGLKAQPRAQSPESRA